MERKDLLSINGKVFVGQGKAIAENAAPGCRVFVVGNPATPTASSPFTTLRACPENFFAMTQLDEYCAKSQLAAGRRCACDRGDQHDHLGQPPATQYPDFTNAKIGGKPVTEVISDIEWLKTDFIKTVQQSAAPPSSRPAAFPPLLPQPTLP